MRIITKRNRGVKLETVVRELNLLISGWVRYFKLASYKGIFQKLDEWVRRKVRCYRIKQLKRGKAIARMLRSKGITKESASKVAYSGKGLWRISNTPQINRAMSIGWTKEIGLKSLFSVYTSSL